MKETGIMKKVFKMLDVDCANCAAKMENAIAKLDGVQKVTISFLAQKMTLEADDARFDEIVKQAVACCKQVDPECEVVVK